MLIQLVARDLKMPSHTDMAGHAKAFDYLAFDCHGPLSGKSMIIIGIVIIIGTSNFQFSMMNTN